VKFSTFLKLYHEILHFFRELGWSLVITETGQDHPRCWMDLTAQPCTIRN